ncbi:hypothetical protein FGIG_01101 [Fasciola gigantica]|uniref:Uncharacterized protein n=1 Tax=Fasciola gigantica TaxID=46835 RepID=A0A504Y916_FASGI|nr:hypothetical protein FGIG_01101 [Fasciola gigantica]
MKDTLWYESGGLEIIDEYTVALTHTEKITREIPPEPWELGLMCRHVFITKIDKQKSEYIPRDCDVLNFDLEKSTITFTLRVPRNIVNCYQLDVDDIKVVWNE